MPQGGEVADVSPISPFLIGFKPRQVLLAERQQQLRNSKLPTPMAKNQDMESVLACSVALWLENKGYSKILKRFLSLAQIQDDDWRAKAHDLNEVFSKHLATTKDVVVDASSQKKKELEIVGSVQINGGANGCSGEEIETKKKKKKNKVGDALAVPAKTSDEVAADTRGRMSDVSSDSNTEKANELPVDQSHKLKKDKKKKGTDTVAESIDNLTDTGKAVESKDKKKKKKLKDNNMEVDKDCDLGSKRKEDAATTESKQASKKRKRVVDDEAENEPEKEMAVQELKPKKSKGEKEGKDIQVQDTVPAKHVGESNMEDLKNGVDSFSQPKSGRKQNGNSSAEPTSVNAFQRVKIDEVEFADERLQDNSYWAKHGAETGYGAKAQEVLGQVRGRDFRHEKTKKKRGSYRGGVIDLQSHSIKFDNSDDE